MAKNLLECLPHLTEQELDYITLALAASRADYRALPREQLKREKYRWLGFLCRKEVRDALIKAEVKGRLPVGAADAIARKHLGDQ
jgi:hypothetical protein